MLPGMTHTGALVRSNFDEQCCSMRGSNVVCWARTVIHVRTHAMPCRDAIHEIGGFGALRTVCPMQKQATSPWRALTHPTHRKANVGCVPPPAKLVVGKNGSQLVSAAVFNIRALAELHVVLQRLYNIRVVLLRLAKMHVDLHSLGKGRGRDRQHLSAKTNGDTGDTADGQERRDVNSQYLKGAQDAASNGEPRQQGADGHEHLLQVSPLQAFQLRPRHPPPSCPFPVTTSHSGQARCPPGLDEHVPTIRTPSTSLMINQLFDDPLSRPIGIRHCRIDTLGQCCSFGLHSTNTHRQMGYFMQPA